MEKIFYRIPLDLSNPYKLICLVANNTNKNDLGDVIIESSFGTSIGVDYLYSLSVLSQIAFESLLEQNNIAYEKLELNNQYQEYLVTRTNNEPLENLDTSFLCNDEMDIILDIDIPLVICGPGTTRVFLEEEITRKDKVKIYVHSNERCGHHIPHVHAKYNDNDNYCVISLVDISVLVPINLKNAKTKDICELVSNHLQASRAAWNRTNSLLKFTKDKDGYTSTYCKSPH